MKRDINKSLYKAGLHLFQTKGYFNCDIRSIAKEAGIGLGTFYNYYKDKLSLYLTIYKKEYMEVANRLLNYINKRDIDSENLIFNLEELLWFHLKSHHHTPLFYSEAEVLYLTEPRVKELEESLKSVTIENFKKIIATLNISHINIEVGIPIIFNLVESTIHSITQDEESNQRVIIKELTKIVLFYLRG